MRRIKKSKQQIIPIQFLESNRLKLKKPLYVVLEYHPQDNLYIVDSIELNIYGVGEDESSAIEDFKIVLEEFYFGLKKDKDILSPQLQKIWEFLNEVLEEKEKDFSRLMNYANSTTTQYNPDLIKPQYRFNYLTEENNNLISQLSIFFKNLKSWLNSRKVKKAL